MIIVDVGTSFFIRISEKAAIAMLCNCKDKQHPKVEGVVGKKRKGTEKKEVGLRQLTLAAIEDYAFMSYISEIATKAKQVFLVPYLPRLVVRAEGITASLATWKKFFGAQHFFKNLLSALVKVSNLHTSLLTRFFIMSVKLIMFILLTSQQKFTYITKISLNKC